MHTLAIFIQIILTNFGVASVSVHVRFASLAPNYLGHERHRRWFSMFSTSIGWIYHIHICVKGSKNLLGVLQLNLHNVCHWHIPCHKRFATSLWEVFFIYALLPNTNSFRASGQLFVLLRYEISERRNTLLCIKKYSKVCTKSLPFTRCVSINHLA